MAALRRTRLLLIKLSEVVHYYSVQDSVPMIANTQGPSGQCAWSLPDEPLRRPPQLPSTIRCQAWASEITADPFASLSSGVRSQLAGLASYWLRPFLARDIAEGRACPLVMVRGGRVFVEMPQWSRNSGLNFSGCETNSTTGEKSRLSTVLRLLLIALRTAKPVLPDFHFRLCGDDFCHGYWEGKPIPIFTMVSCSDAPTIPAVQWNTLEQRDPDLSVWQQSLSQHRRLRDSHARRWSCRKDKAVWRGSLNDPFAYNLQWTSNQTVRRVKIDASNWHQAGRAALAYQRCVTGRALIDTRIKLLRTRLQFVDRQCIAASSTDKPSHLTFRYIVHVEGNGGWADRLRHLLLSGALVLKQDMGVHEWFEPLLKPWVHFVPVSSTLHNLSNAVHWARANDALAQAIAARVAALIEDALSEAGIVYYQSELFRQFAELSKATRSAGTALTTAPGSVRGEFQCANSPTKADVPSVGPDYIARDCFLKRIERR
jgi:hypothetical protein